MVSIVRILAAAGAAVALAGCATAPAGPAVDAKCRVGRVVEDNAAGRPVPMDELGGLGNPPLVLMATTEIEAVAECLAPALDAAIARSADATIRTTRGWVPASRAYMASEHGMFLQVYANAAGAEYLKYEKGARLPQGAAILKRSFRVAADGSSAAGPVFVMERMAPGYDAATNDWRFAVTAPDGALVGESGGRDAAKVAFCAGCHVSARVQDFLFFVPPRYRN
ncbi:MAG: cytochrome P460 family protein [Rhodospirillales bacterium]|nr:cytochrome P460 family protein [Rhodospirillales bacterium]